MSALRHEFDLAIEKLSDRHAQAEDDNEYRAGSHGARMSLWVDHVLTMLRAASDDRLFQPSASLVEAIYQLNERISAAVTRNDLSFLVDQCSAILNPLTRLRNVAQGRPSLPWEVETPAQPVRARLSLDLTRPEPRPSSKTYSSAFADGLWRVTNGIALACSGSDVPPVAREVGKELVKLADLVNQYDSHRAPHRLSGHALVSAENDLLAVLPVVKRKLLDEEPLGDELAKVRTLVSTACLGRTSHTRGESLTCALEDDNAYQSGTR